MASMRYSRAAVVEEDLKKAKAKALDASEPTSPVECAPVSKSDDTPSTKSAITELKPEDCDPDSQ